MFAEALGSAARPRLPLIRSALFVPGNRPDWVLKAASTGADAIVIDLEDAVPQSQKTEARAALVEMLGGPNRPSIPVMVRVNAPTSDLVLRDVEAVAGLGIVGVMVPKIDSIADIAVVDRMLSWFESRNDDAVRIIPLLESAWAIRNAYEIASASARVAYMGGIASKGGDVERALGYRWSAEGRETITMRSHVLLDARAAGVPNPLTGLWSDVDDLGGLRDFAISSRNLGYEGLVVIHPSHVRVVNDVFTPSPDELDYDVSLIRTMTEAAQTGRGAVRFRGHMIDEAMLATSIARADRYRPEWRDSDAISVPELGERT